MKKLLKTKQKEFLLFLEEIRGYSDLTIKSYDDSLSEALLHMETVEEKGHILFNLMPYRIKIASLNPKTISKKLSAVRSFVGYLNENGISVVLRSDESVKIAKTLPKPISHEHILEALLDATLEERVVITLLYTLGLRISELAALELGSISDEWVRVLGKGDKQRDVPLLESSKKLLDDYFGKYKLNRFVFEKNGEKLSENSLRYMVIKVFGRVGLKVSPHQHHLLHRYYQQIGFYILNLYKKC